MADFPVKQRLSSNAFAKKKQNAVKALNNYLNQIKIHFDFDDKDIVKVLEAALKEKKHEVFVKKWWHMLK